MVKLPAKAPWVLAIKVAISLTLVALLARYLGTQPLYRVNEANLYLLALGSAVCIGLMAITTVKWQLLLVEQGVKIGFGTLFQIQLASQFLNLFMPTVLGGDAYRVMKLRAHTDNLYDAVPSVLVDRATGLGALLFIGILGIAYAFTSQPVWGVAVVLVLVAAAAYWLLIGPLANWIYQLPDSGRFSKLLQLGKKLIDAARPSRTLLYVVAISLVFQFIVVCVAYIYVAAIDVRASMWHLLVVVPAVNVMEMIPISISGVGVREMSYTALFDKLKLDPANGLALGITASLMRYVTGALCGAAFLWSGRVTNPRTPLVHPTHPIASKQALDYVPASRVAPYNGQCAD